MVVHCQGCGSAVRATAATVQCCYCGHRQVVDPQLFNRLMHYQQGFAAAQGQASDQLTQAQRFDDWAEKGSTANSYILTVGVLLLCAIPLGLGQAWEAELLTQTQSWALGGGLALVVITVMVWLMWPSRGSGRAALRLGEGSEAACPTCGADNAFAHGDPWSACAYCGTTLLASNAVIRDGLDAAGRSARHAELERVRAWRELQAGTDSFDVHVTVAIVAFMTICAPGVSLFSGVLGEETVVPGGVFVVVMVVGFVGVTGFLLWRKSRLRALERAVEAFAQRSQGVATHHPKGSVAWLNAFWPAPFDVELLSKTSRIGAVSDVVAGYAAHTLFVTPWGEPSELHVLLAARLPPCPGGMPEQIQALQHAGFQPYATPAGLHLVATEPLADRVAAEPGHLAHIAPVLTRAAESLRSWGAVAVGASQGQT